MKKREKLKTERTSRGLRDTLFSELDLLRNGESEPMRASAVAKLAVQIINSAMLEVHLQRTDLSVAEGDRLLRVRPLLLGTVL